MVELLERPEELVFAVVFEDDDTFDWEAVNVPVDLTDVVPTRDELVVCVLVIVLSSLVGGKRVVDPGAGTGTSGVVTTIGTAGGSGAGLVVITVGNGAGRSSACRFAKGVKLIAGMIT